jgi:hypothetical protein
MQNCEQSELHSESVKKRETLQANRVTKVAVFSHSQAAIRRTEHLEGSH